MENLVIDPKFWAASVLRLAIIRPPARASRRKRAVVKSGRLNRTGGCTV
jgi:hypothetical protein